MDSYIVTMAAMHAVVVGKFRINAQGGKSINLAMIGVMLMQNGDVIIKTWILLDTCSTDSMTKNLDYVGYIENCTKDKEIKVLINGGLILFDRKG